MPKPATVLLVALVFAGIAGPAHGATVRLAEDPGSGELGVNYVAADGELNVVNLGDGPWQGTIRVQGGWTPIDAVAPCWAEFQQGLGYFGHCPAQGVAHVRIDLGDGADHFSNMGFTMPLVVDGGAGPDAIWGGRSADHLTGGPGQDQINGLYGADRIFVRDGFADDVICDSGVDTVDADSSDSVAEDCELQAAGSPPEAITVVASDVGQTRATLNGVANARGLATTIRFEYGPTTGYGSTTPARPLGTVDGAVVVAETVELSPGATYHFRLVATSSAGSSYGRDVTFRTAPAPAPLRVCLVPRLAGLTLAAARRRLLRAGCRLGTVRTARSRSRRRGTVVAQSLRPGARRPHAARVHVLISVGRRSR
jgi:RTX calcium-binding nonapeptide repeat (4 copies)/PASTA domain